MPAPALHFRYHTYTYDVLWSKRYDRFYDSFNVSIGPTVVFTDGNKTQVYGVLHDLEWRGGAVDLAPYSGQTLQVCLANQTRIDTLFNTWSIVDDVRLVNLEHRLFDFILRKASRL